MSSGIIELTRNDTRPSLTVQLTQDCDGGPLNVSAAGDTVVLKFRKVGASTIKATLTAAKLIGYEDADGNLDVAAPYNVAGAGGRVQFDWTPGTLDTAGRFEGEIEITFADTSVQTVRDRLQFDVLPDF